MPEKEGPYSGPTKAGKFRPHKGLKREFLVSTPRPLFAS